MDNSELQMIGTLKWLLLGSLGLTMAACGSGDFGECTNPEPVSDEYDSGLERCQEGYLHRVADNVCPVAHFSEFTEERADYCESDNECGGGQSFCAEYIDSDYRTCRLSCASNDDCGEGRHCVCGESYGRCVGGRDECSSDTDCEGDALCIGVHIGSGCSREATTFRCQSKKDECYVDSECPAGHQCGFGEKGTECFETSVTCGRPFVVQQAPRLAQAVRRNDWSQGDKPGDSLSEEGSSSAAHFFESIALMEHASIAAFARFSLSLLSLGAPADLIERTNDALRDETEHTRLAFGLVRRFSGEDRGPGPLSLAGCTLQIRPEELLEFTIIEGCIGETVAALEARAITAQCRDEQVRSVFDKIAKDESQHAVLAWQTVRWILHQYPQLKEVAGEIFRASCETPHPESALVAADDRLSELGLPQEAQRIHVRREALHRVVRPCATALLDSIITPSQTSKSRNGHPTSHFC